MQRTNSVTGLVGLSKRSEEMLQRVDELSKLLEQTTHLLQQTANALETTKQELADEREKSKAVSDMLDHIINN